MPALPFQAQKQFPRKVKVKLKVRTQTQPPMRSWILSYSILNHSSSSKLFETPLLMHSRLQIAILVPVGLIPISAHRSHSSSLSGSPLVAYHLQPTALGALMTLQVYL